MGLSDEVDGGAVSGETMSGGVAEEQRSQGVVGMSDQVHGGAVSGEKLSGAYQNAEGYRTRLWGRRITTTNGVTLLTG